MPPSSSAHGRPPGAHPDWPEDAIEIGRILDAWGLKGWVRVRPFSADPQALFSSRRWFLLPSEKAGPPSVAAAIPGLLKITQVKDHGDGVVALAQEIADRNAAEAVRGARVFVARTSFPTAGPDEFYWVDLLGLAVENRAGEPLGAVVGLIDTGPHSVLRVLPAGAAEVGEAERLIPFVAAYVDEVSLAERRIRVDWGLDY